MATEFGKIKYERGGGNTTGVLYIKGDRKSPEPLHLIVSLPFGTVEISRTSDDNYWVHCAVRQDMCGVEGRPGTTHIRAGKLIEYRIDGCTDQEESRLENVDGNHFAVKLVGVKKPSEVSTPYAEGRIN